MRTPPRTTARRSSLLPTLSRTAIANGILVIALALMAFAKGGGVTITTPSLPNAVEGTPYSGTVNASGGCTPYTWSIASGSLPPGLTGQPSSSTTSYVISGTPTGTGNDTFEVQVEGCGRHISQKTYTVQVQQPNYAVNLNWNASGSPDITGYNVYRGTTSGGPYGKINTGGLVGSTTYTDATVAQNTTYYYVTTAVNSSNQESPYSNQTTAEIP